MAASHLIFWEVDVQADFMLPEGRLYIPGAEKLLPNIRQLVDVARRGQVLLISSADAHNLSDPELLEWPPHCLKDSPGAELLPQASASPQLVIPNRQNFDFPDALQSYRQILLQKNTLDVFDNPNADLLLQKLAGAVPPLLREDALFVVFGVATDYCVRCTAEGLLSRRRPLAVVVDAIHAIDEKKGREILQHLESRGARLVTAEEALALAADGAKMRSTGSLG